MDSKVELPERVIISPLRNKSVTYIVAGVYRFLSLRVF